MIQEVTKIGISRCEMGSDVCTEMLKNDYRFYAAFENSLCKDYITEKSFNNMKNDIIPIVYGEANYKLYAPPKSYINANDFETVQDLAKYLKFLIENPTEYLKYFWWREHYRVLDDYEFYNITYCKLCQKLHEPGVLDGYKVYESIYK
jgi:alpha-1,3-fucosyltransferase